jgi:PAS domain S-box-containing protein
MSNENLPTVLIVDDDENNLYALTKIMEEIDIPAHAVASGEEALKAILNKEFFLILMDVFMPGMDGFETVSLIKGNENHKDIPVIFITAQSEKKFVDSTYEEGVVDVIFKPILNTYPLICKIKVFLELYLNRKKLEQRSIELARQVTESNRLRDKEKAVQQQLQDLFDEISISQQALLVKEQEQREILDSIVNAVITIDETGSIVSFNKTAEVLFNYSFDEISGQNISRLMPEPDSGKHDSYLQHYLETGDARVIWAGREVVGQRKNKETFPMRLSIAELPIDETGKRRFIGSCQDLTCIKQQEELLRRTQKMDALGNLTGGIAHDFNNMLGIIIGYSDLLTAQLAEQPKLVVYVKQIMHAGERGAKLTNKLLSFSRKKSPEAVKLNINTLLGGQQYMLQKTLTVRIKLVINFGDNIWPLWLDNSDLENALLNMSINAMHAMDENKLGACLTIQTCNQSFDTRDALTLGIKAGDYVQLSLTDTGCGMDAETREKIFEPFFTTKGDRGTGLGLSQVFGFVKRAGGTIKTYSEIGHGSKFVLYFPRYHDGDVEIITESRADDISLRGKENILIVDDEAALRDLTSELLSSQGYQVYCAESAKQALIILEQKQIDLMISDVIMPEMDGYQLSAIVQEKYPDLKIQLASGFTDERHEGIINESLHQNLLYKPYNSQVLFKNIRALLD